MKCVAIDVGNVLCMVDFSKFQRELNKITDTKIFLEKIQIDQDLGKTTITEEIKKLNNKNFKYYEQLWNDSILFDKRMINFKNDLIHRGYRVAILSNMGRTHKNFIIKKYPSILKGCIEHISCDVGKRKPQIEFYLEFLKQHPEFEGCLYIDDIEENLDIGEKLGFRAFYMDLNKVSKYNSKKWELFSRNLRYAIIA